VKATNFQHPSSAAANITLGADGSVVLPQGFTGGLGTNVAQGVKTDTFSTSSATFTPLTGLTASITPSSATSKMLVIVQLNYTISAVSHKQAYFRLTGGNSAAYIGDADSNRIRVTGADVGWETDQRAGTRMQTAVYLDSPATTSPITYGVDVSVSSAASTVFVNRSSTDTDTVDYARSASSITVIEVAA
jgi:hypothetical protein